MARRIFSLGGKWVRPVWRAAVCVAAAVCASGVFGGPAWLAGLVPAFSPFVAALTLAAGARPAFLLGAAGVAAACAVWPRLFCRWFCPVGACKDVLMAAVPRRAWVGRVPRVGGWVLAVGLGAALAGYPLFGWLDPLVLFNAAFGVVRREPRTLDWAAAAGFAVLLALALAAPGLWCGRVCPLGAIQDALRVPARLWAARRAGGQAERRGGGLGRRAFLGLGAGAGYRLVFWPGRAQARGPIRPPASWPPERFTRLCVRCGACVRACPSGIIRFGGAGGGWAGVLAPEVSYEDDHCNESCRACGQACPTGAIRRFSLADKFVRPMGRAQVDHDRCLLGRGRECGACVSACPYGALDLSWDPVELASRVVVDGGLCTGCGACEYVCVTTPRSITVGAWVAAEPLPAGGGAVRKGGADER